MTSEDTCLRPRPHTFEGHFTRSKERTSFPRQRVFADFGWIFLENERIFAKKCTRFFRSEMPLAHVAVHYNHKHFDNEFSESAALPDFCYF